MSRQELAEAVNAYLFTHTKRVYDLNAHYVGRLERGARHWPNADYRQGFRAVLGAQSDAELGFSRTGRSGKTWADEAMAALASVIQKTRHQAVANKAEGEHA
jgi:hypothetical protein